MDNIFDIISQSHGMFWEPYTSYYGEELFEFFVHTVDVDVVQIDALYVARIVNLFMFSTCTSFFLRQTAFPWTAISIAIWVPDWNAWFWPMCLFLIMWPWSVATWAMDVLQTFCPKCMTPTVEHHYEHVIDKYGIGVVIRVPWWQTCPVSLPKNTKLPMFQETRPVACLEPVHRWSSCCEADPPTLPQSQAAHLTSAPACFAGL